MPAGEMPPHTERLPGDTPSASSTKYIGLSDLFLETLSEKNLSVSCYCSCSLLFLFLYCQPPQDQGSVAAISSACQPQDVVVPKSSGPLGFQEGLETADVRDSINANRRMAWDGQQPRSFSDRPTLLSSRR